MKDKVVIVTGGASGIGLATVERLGRDGARLVIADKADPSAVAERVRAAGGTAEAIAADVSQEAACAAMVEAARSAYGRLDVLINCAGVNKRNRAEDAGLEEFEFIMGVNLRGTFLACRAAIPAIRESGGGSIVTVASELALMGIPNISIYTASKGGIISMTRALAADHVADGIRVNCVCPGPVDTPLLRQGIVNAPDPAAREKASIESTMMKRHGRPEEIANVIRFLASDEASFMTGSIVVADGGATAQ
jgi:meso-butanediol dehydrogenase/(S,S)-butanediol dehydrogenase/diacetyl reductase